MDDVFAEFTKASLDAEYNLCEITQAIQEFIQDALNTVNKSKSEELNELLKSHRKVHKVIAEMSRTDKEAFAYGCGVFIGAYKVLQEMSDFYMSQEKFKNALKALEWQDVSYILVYLYNNPDVNQEKIVREIKTSPSYLSEALDLLVREGYVQRYGKNKGTIYHLTKEGRKIARDEMLNSENCANR